MKIICIKKVISVHILSGYSSVEETSIEIGDIFEGRILSRLKDDWYKSEIDDIYIDVYFIDSIDIWVPIEYFTPLSIYRNNRIDEIIN